MAAEAILALDQGTTNTKALLVGRDGVAFFRHAVPVTLLTPQAHHIEQDPDELWQSVLACIAACVSYARRSDVQIKGIAITNQRETALAWRAGVHAVAITNAISWQCRRSNEICDGLEAHSAVIECIAGLPVDPLNSAGKWAWLLERDDQLQFELIRGDVLLGTVDAWLLYNLTGGKGHKTDHSNASRTGVYSLRAAEWSDELLGLYGMSRSGLPEIQASASYFGLCSSVPELKDVPIVAMIGDSHAALVGHGRYSPGTVKATYGTGSSLMMLTEGLLPHTQSLARTVAWSDSEGIRFALEGNIAMSGSAVQWVGEFLGLANPTDDTVALADTVNDAEGLRFVPAMAGLGAPHWDTHARGLVANLGKSHRAAHLARAATDAIAFQVADVLACLEDSSGSSVPFLLVDGGATRNEGLMQFQANLISRPVLRSVNEEVSAIGAAWLGGLTLGWWTSAAELESLPHETTRYEPAITPDEREQLQSSWQMAVRRARLAGREGLA